MTQVLSPSDSEVKDFTSHIDVTFRVDDDIFRGVHGIPAMDLIEFGAIFNGLTESQVASDPDAFPKLFTLVLDEPSAKVFLRRMKDKSHPISLQQCMEILPWLMEQYGMRPTEPSSNSSNGSPNQDDGTSSTVNALETVSTPSLSPRHAS